jgi:hypothetical protein
LNGKRRPWLGVTRSSMHGIASLFSRFAKDALFSIKILI